MKRVAWAALCATAAMALGAPAAATTFYDITLTGYLTSQGPGPDDANLHVGDTITLTARISDAYVVQNFGGFGYDVAASWRNWQKIPLSGAEFWRIDGGGLTWGAGDDVYDGAAPWYSKFDDPAHSVVDLAGPGIAFENGKVIAFGSNAAFFSVGPLAPRINFAAVGHGVEHIHCTEPTCTGPLTYTSSFTEGSFSPDFSISEAGGLYGNDRYTPGFTGFWDFANSCVITEGIGPQTCSPAGVPEPSTWVLMLSGFCGLGLALRRRRAVMAAAA